MVDAEKFGPDSQDVVRHARELHDLLAEQVSMPQSPASSIACARYAMGDNVRGWKNLLDRWDRRIRRQGSAFRIADFEKSEMSERFSPIASLSGAMGALLRNFGYPLCMWSGFALHCFTAFTAYTLAAPGWKGYGALIAAWAIPLVSEAVVAYYSWRASGSIVNTYSVWLLMWLAIGLGVWWLTEINIRLERERS